MATKQKSAKGATATKRGPGRPKGDGAPAATAQVAAKTAAKDKSIPKDVGTMAKAFNAIADPNRLAILGMLAEGDSNLAGITGRYGFEAKEATGTLATFKKLGWVEAFREEGKGGWNYRMSGEGRRFYDAARGAMFPGGA